MSNESSSASTDPMPEEPTAESTHFSIGAEVTCADGVCGKLTWVVIDPVSRSLTHLVVEPKHRQGLGRLVPVDLVLAADQEIRLRCTAAEFGKLGDAEETQFLAMDNGGMGYGSGQARSWPYYGMGGMGMGGMGMGVGGMGMGMAPQAIVHDKVPLGEVQVHRGDKVHASDGVIGSVQGLVIEPHEHHVTHVLLQEGHLWGRKQVAIPIRSVTSVEDGIQVSLTKSEVGELPPIDLDSTS